MADNTDGTIPCPVCDGGTLRRSGLVMRDGVCALEDIDCSTCGESGRVPADYAARVEAGQRMRAERVARRESLRDAAARLGITPAQLSAREMGRHEEATR